MKITYLQICILTFLLGFGLSAIYLNPPLQIEEIIAMVVIAVVFVIVRIRQSNQKHQSIGEKYDE